MPFSGRGMSCRSCRREVYVASLAQEAREWATLYVDGTCSYSAGQLSPGQHFKFPTTVLASDHARQGYRGRRLRPGAQSSERAIPLQAPRTFEPTVRLASVCHELD